jgi:hypothetical protein
VFALQVIPRPGGLNKQETFARTRRLMSGRKK